MVVHQSQHDDAEGILQLGMLVQLVQHDFRHHIAAQLDDDAHALPVGFIPQVGDPFQGLVLYQVGDALDEFRLVHLVGNLGDHDPVLVLGHGFHVGLGPHLHHTPACGISLADAGQPQDLGARREIRPLDGRHQLVNGGIRMVDEHNAGIHHFAQVVGRNVGGHAHSDPGGSIDEQGRHLGWQHRGFLQGFIVVGDEVHRILFDIPQHFHGDLAHPHFRVPHGSRRIPVHRTEVPVAVHHQIPGGEILGQTHDGIVHRRIPMGMVFTQNIAHDTGGFFIGLVGQHPCLIHGIEDASMDRLQAVPHIRQSPLDNDAHGIVDIAFLHLVFYIDGNDFARGDGLLVVLLIIHVLTLPSCASRRGYFKNRS